MANLTLRNFTSGSITGALDLAVHDREFVVLTGPAGSGSSAIVRAIAGLEDVSAGEILFDDRPFNSLAPKDRDVALVARDYTPYPRLSVFENLAIGLRRRNFAEAETKKRISAVAAILGLDAQLEAIAESLPIGQQRLVGLARAMVRQPRVYLFDQPFDLEPAAARRARAEILNLHQRSSATIVYATSAAAEALAFGQRTVVLSNGVVQQDGPAQAVYDEPANLAVARFFGDPPMNLVAGTLRQERGGVVFSESGDGTITVPLPVARFPEASGLVGRPIVLGFRPEHTEIDGSSEAGRPGAGTFRALVERAESGGAEADLYLNTGAHSLIARSRRWRQQAGGGHRLQFGIALETAHLFDPETGRRVVFPA
jgi:multiple sugar transport system ATP-binding protein